MRHARLWALPVAFFLLTGLGIAQIRGTEGRAATAPGNLQPSERAGENFPGSAFYYIEDDTGLIALAATGAGEDDPIGGVGAVARPFRLGGSAVDKNRALQCLTAAIYYEAALEPDAGQRAVAQVVLNRAAHPSYPDTVCGVVYQGSERQTGCQFTFSCDGSLTRAPSSHYWIRASKVAQDALAGKVYAPAGLATHYHTTEVSPYWAPSLAFMGTIGAHRFYRWKGAAGLKSAFHQNYRGGEPLPRPKPKSNNPAPDADPIAVARAYEEAKAAAERETAEVRATVAHAAAADQTAQHIATSAPDYSASARTRGGERAFGGQNLPEASQIRPEYRNSGRWIAQPAS